MSQKKKISKADISAAINAVDVLISYFEKGQKEKVVIAVAEALLTKTPISIMPFDMVANGASLGAVPDTDVFAFFSRWQVLIRYWEEEEGAVDLQVSLLMICQWLRMSGSKDFSQGAFVGVYGAFRVALEKVLLSAGARLRGGKTVEEIARAANVHADAANMSAEIAKVIARGGKTKNDYLEIQRLQFFISCLEVKDDDCKPKITGKKGLLYQIWDWPGDIQGLKIPKDGGLTKDDCIGKTPLAGRWRRQAEKLGYIETRKNKPGAGGARMRKI